MNYKIGKIGREFLKVMKINRNFKELVDPSIQSLADLVNADKNRLDKNDVENSFYFSVHNPCHYPRMADEIMKNLFASEESKLQELIAELESKKASLISKANSEVEKTINEYRNDTSQDVEERIATGIVCEIFDKIPSHALNLLGLIKINSRHFPKSYHNFKQMLEKINQGDETCGQGEVKGYFSEALKELEKLVKSIKREQEKSNEKNKKQPDEPFPSPPEQNPTKDQPERKKDTPTNSNEGPEKPSNSENNENPNQTDEPVPNNPIDNLLSLKDQVIQEITNTLNEIPKLDNADLFLEYQDWQDQINNFTEESYINFLKEGLLTNIQNQRKEKIKKQTTGEVSEIIDSNFQKAQNPNATIQDKKETLTENEKYEGQPAYEDVNIKEKTKNLKKEVAQDNPTEYRDKIISNLNTKLNKNRLTKEELDNETQDLIKALEEQKISDPSQLVETEMKITQKIAQQGATKKVETFRKKVRGFLKSNNKTKIDGLKKQLTEFIKSNNIYYQAKKGEAQQLLRKLESGSTINSSYSSESLPFSVQIGIGMGAVLVVLFFTILIWKKRKYYLASAKLLPYSN